MISQGAGSIDKVMSKRYNALYRRETVMVSLLSYEKKLGDVKWKKS